MASFFNPSLINPYNFYTTEYLQFDEATNTFTFYTQSRGELTATAAKAVIDLPWYSITEKASFSVAEFHTLIKTKIKYQIDRTRMTGNDRQEAIEYYHDCTIPSLNDLVSSILLSKEEEKEKAILNFLKYACDYNRECTMKNETLYGFEGMWDGFAFNFVSAKPVTLQFRISLK